MKQTPKESHIYYRGSNSKQPTYMGVRIDSRGRVYTDWQFTPIAIRITQHYLLLNPLRTGETEERMVTKICQQAELGLQETKIIKWNENPTAKRKHRLKTVWATGTNDQIWYLLTTQKTEGNELNILEAVGELIPNIQGPKRQTRLKKLGRAAWKKAQKLKLNPAQEDLLTKTSQLLGCCLEHSC